MKMTMTLIRYVIWSSLRSAWRRLRDNITLRDVPCWVRMRKSRCDFHLYATELNSRPLTESPVTASRSSVDERRLADGGPRDQPLPVSPVSGLLTLMSSKDRSSWSSRSSTRDLSTEVHNSAEDFAIFSEAILALPSRQETRLLVAATATGFLGRCNLLAAIRRPFLDAPQEERLTWDVSLISHVSRSVQ